MNISIGKFLSFKLKTRKNTISGFVIDYNDDWTLLKYSPCDYILDGYLIFKNKLVQGYTYDEDEIFIEKIIKLKGYKMSKEKKWKLPLEINKILSKISKENKAFQIETRNEGECFIGSLNSIKNEKTLVVNYMNTKGIWDGTMNFRIDSINLIQYDNDYINSLLLLQ